MLSFAHLRKASPGAAAALLCALALPMVSQPIAAPATSSQVALPTTSAQPAVKPAAPSAAAQASNTDSGAKQLHDSRHYTSHELAERPYTPILTAPLYPSTPRVQKQFAVRYLYNYAQSAYTPSVALPQIGRASADRSTPEGALIALYSAIRSGDYEGWLSCWDDASRKKLEDLTATKKNGAEFWRTAWRQFYSNKRISMIDRIETVNYVMLDLQVEDPAKPGTATPDAQVFLFEHGGWFATNAMTYDGLIMNFQPGKSSIDKDVEIHPFSDFTSPGSIAGKAQQEFFQNHNKTNAVTQTVE